MLGRGSQVKIRGQQNNSKSYEYHLSSGTEAGQFLVNLARSELFGRLYEGETGVDHTIGVGAWERYCKKSGGPVPDAVSNKIGDRPSFCTMDSERVYITAIGL